MRLTLAEFHDLFRDAEIQYVDGNSNNQQHQPQQSQPANAQSQVPDAGFAQNSPIAKYNDQPSVQAGSDEEDEQQVSRGGPELRFDTSVYSSFKHLNDNLADLKSAASERQQQQQATIVVDGRLIDLAAAGKKSSSKLRRNLTRGTHRVIAISQNARHLLKARLGGSRVSSLALEKSKKKSGKE